MSIEKKKMGRKTSVWRRASKRLKRHGDKKEIKSIIFVPHTKDSNMLRDKERVDHWKLGEDIIEGGQKDREYNGKQSPMEKQSASYA